MKTNFNCKNFRPGYSFCELCRINKKYIDLQNNECKSCFEPDMFNIKPA